MSRSRRKTAITGITTARSEKYDKRLMNRAIRRITKTRISNTDSDEYLHITKDEARDIWSMAKDGKTRHDKVNKPQCHMCTGELHCLVDESYKAKCELMWHYHWYLKALRK